MKELEKHTHRMQIAHWTMTVDTCSLDPELGYGIIVAEMTPEIGEDLEKIPQDAFNEFTRWSNQIEEEIASGEQPYIVKGPAMPNVVILCCGTGGDDQIRIPIFFRDSVDQELFLADKINSLLGTAKYLWDIKKKSIK